MRIYRLESGEEGILLETAEGVFDDPVIERSARHFLNDPRHYLVAAVDNGIVIGFASAVEHLHPDKSGPELWINEIGVASSYRRRGIAKQLMRKVLESGRENGCYEAWVLTERSNTSAMGLYRSLGCVEASCDQAMLTFDLAKAAAETDGSDGDGSHCV